MTLPEQTMTTVYSLRMMESHSFTFDGRIIQLNHYSRTIVNSTTEPLSSAHECFEVRLMMLLKDMLDYTHIFAKYIQAALSTRWYLTHLKGKKVSIVSFVEKKLHIRPVKARSRHGLRSCGMTSLAVKRKEKRKFVYIDLIRMHVSWLHVKRFDSVVESIGHPMFQDRSVQTVPAPWECSRSEGSIKSLGINKFTAIGWENMSCLDIW